MTTQLDPFFELFELRAEGGGRAQLMARAGAQASSVPDPQTGRPIKVATVELSNRTVCPACAQLGSGGYISFVADLRLAFACPSCCRLIWIAGA